MDYKETVAWLFQQLPAYQRQGAAAYKVDLTNIQKLAAYLDSPENSFKSIHVAGTNGKGSTSHMIASILQDAGYKVGLYTSPHLKDFRERIRINGKKIEKEYVVDFVSKHKAFFNQTHLSFFEMTVGLAYNYFSEKEVDIAVVEVGLGGRLDSTNIITPEVSVITNIGLDHTTFLGTTLPEIAYEKAGIIKKNVPVVIGEYRKETFPVFSKIATEKNAKIYLASQTIKNYYQLDLLGDYQQKNYKTAVQAIKLLNDFSIAQVHIVEGLKKVVENTGLLGRWQILNKNPKTICDTAHNKEGLQIVLQQLKKEEYQTLHIILGVVNDKKLENILPLFPKEAKYYFCSPKIQRALPVKELKKDAEKYQLNGNSYNSVSEAYAVARKVAKSKDVIYIGGSTFVVAEIL